MTNKSTPALYSFLQDHCISKNDKSTKHQTHSWVSLDYEYVRTLSIPSDRKQNLFKLYHEFVTSDAYKLNDTYSIAAITEKIDAKFPLFADIDFKLKLFKEHNIDTKNIPSMMNWVIDAWKLVVSKARNDALVNVVSSFRMAYKCHLHFQNVIVDRNIANALSAMVREKLIKDHPEYEKIWIDAVDKSVYSNGLRLLWSQKGHMGVKSLQEEKALHKELLPGSEYLTVYRIGHLREDGTVSYKPDFDSADLTATSIHIDQSIQLSSFNIEVVQTKVAVPSDRNMGNKVTLPAVSIEKYEDVMTDIKPHLEKMFKVVHFANIKTFPGTKHLEMTIIPQECPFAGRLHTRSAERNTPANYLLVTPDCVTVKCWSCTDQSVRIPLTKKYSSLEEMKSSNKGRLFHSLLMGTHETVSNFIFHELKYKFAASPIKNGYKWFYYDEQLHRWVEYEKIILAIMEDKGPIQTTYKAAVDEQLPKLEDDKKEAVKKSWFKLRRELQNTQYVRGGLLPLLARKLEFYWRQGSTCFEGRLDQNAKLLGFNNGVWDLGTRTFRPGKPEDFISMSTTIDYIPYRSITPKIRAELEAFLDSILLDKVHRHYVLQEISSALDGTPSQQRFFIWSGAGANGKSTLVRLLELSLGDFVGTSNTSLVTKDRPPSSGTSSDIATLKGKRYVIMHECNEKDTLYLGTIKNLTGGDRQNARKLYENDQVFKLQATFFMLTNNYPSIHANQSDFGTWRRIRPVSFDSRFVENPSRPGEFKVDDTLDQKLVMWKEAFASMLVDCFLRYERLEQPPAFKRIWEQLQTKNDLCLRFIKDMLCVDANKESETFMDVVSLYRNFREWLKTLGIHKVVNFDNFERQLTFGLGKPQVRDGSTGWTVSVKSIAIM